MSLGGAPKRHKSTRVMDSAKAIASSSANASREPWESKLADMDLNLWLNSDGLDLVGQNALGGMLGAGRDDFPNGRSAAEDSTPITPAMIQAHMDDCVNRHAVFQDFGLWNLCFFNEVICKKHRGAIVYEYPSIDELSSPEFHEVRDPVWVPSQIILQTWELDSKQQTLLKTYDIYKEGLVLLAVKGPVLQRRVSAKQRKAQQEGKTMAQQMALTSMGLHAGGMTADRFNFSSHLKFYCVYYNPDADEWGYLPSFRRTIYRCNLNTCRRSYRPPPPPLPSRASERKSTSINSDSSYGELRAKLMRRRYKSNPERWSPEPLIECPDCHGVYYCNMAHLVQDRTRHCAAGVRRECHRGNARLTRQQFVDAYFKRLEEDQLGFLKEMEKDFFDIVGKKREMQYRQQAEKYEERQEAKKQEAKSKRAVGKHRGRKRALGADDDNDAEDEDDVLDEDALGPLMDMHSRDSALFDPTELLDVNNKMQQLAIDKSKKELDDIQQQVVLQERERKRYERALRSLEAREALDKLPTPAKTKADAKRSAKGKKRDMDQGDDETKDHDVDKKGDDDDTIMTAVNAVAAAGATSSSEMSHGHLKPASTVAASHTSSAIASTAASVPMADAPRKKRKKYKKRKPKDAAASAAVQAANMLVLKGLELKGNLQQRAKRERATPETTLPIRTLESFNATQSQKLAQHKAAQPQLRQRVPFSPAKKRMEAATATSSATPRMALSDTRVLARETNTETSNTHRHTSASSSSSSTSSTIATTAAADTSSLPFTDAEDEDVMIATNDED